MSILREKYQYGKGKCYCKECRFYYRKKCDLGQPITLHGCRSFVPKDRRELYEARSLWNVAWNLGDDIQTLYRLLPRVGEVYDNINFVKKRGTAYYALGEIGIAIYFHTEVLEEFVRELNRLIKGTSTMKKEIVKSQKVFAELPPCNEKSLFNFICQTMHAVATENISTDRALAISKLSSNAIQLMRNEIERGKLIEVSAQNGRVAQIRELSMKGFDDTTKFKDNQSYYIEETSTVE